MLIDRRECAAVLVDYQDKILSAMYNKDELLAASKILLQGLKVLGVPMCKTQQYTKGLGMTNAEIDEASGLLSEQYYEKVIFSAFGAVSDFIKDKKYIILCGIEAHVCVLQTAIELKTRGFSPILVTDCVGSRTPYNHKAAIRRAKQEGIILTSYEALLFELTASAEAPAFREISKLVK